jgi:uncharacterized protein (TIGR02466 family)
MPVEICFPVTIFNEKELFSTEQNKIWADYSLELKKTVPSAHTGWYGGTYTTFDSNQYNLKNDPMFTELINAVTVKVNEFAKEHGSDTTYDCQHAWVNIADKDNYQEFHTHIGSVFSVVYYVSVPEGSGKIVFEDPKEPDMMPLRDVKNQTPLSYRRIFYPSETGSLVIFRSYLRHMVEPGTNIEPRISISMNFI